MKNQSKEKIIYKISTTTIIINLFLTLIKLFAGIFGRSMAMISDAIHSGSDVLSTAAVMVGAKLSGKKADKKHPYGHEKIESVTSIILAVMLFASAVSVGFCGVSEIIKCSKGSIPAPEAYVMWFALLSIVLKEWMYRYTKKASIEIKSPALYADAWHHRSDAFSSVGALIGVAGANLGLAVLDPIASIIICLIIVKVSFKIAKTGLDQIIDTSASPDVEKKITDIIGSYAEIIKIDLLKTRQFGSKVYVDAEVRINKDMSFQEVHTLVHKLRDDIERHNESVKHCMIHANPSED